MSKSRSIKGLTHRIRGWLAKLSPQRWQESLPSPGNVRYAGSVLLLSNGVALLSAVSLFHTNTSLLVVHAFAVLVNLALLVFTPSLMKARRFGRLWRVALFWGMTFPAVFGLFSSGYHAIWVVATVWVISAGFRLQDWRRNHLAIGLAIVVSLAYLLLPWGGSRGPELLGMSNGSGLVAMVVGLLWIIEWVSQKRIRQTRLSKMELAQSTLGMVAHDLATPLARAGFMLDAIKSRSEVLSDDPQKMAKALNEVNKLTDRTLNLMAGITQQVTGQIASAVVQFKSIENTSSVTDVTQAIIHAVEFQCATHELSPQIIRRHFEANPILRCDQNLFAAMISNLVGNAIRAVQARGRPMEAGDISIAVATLPGQAITPMMRILVSDRGVGMDKETAAAIFESKGRSLSISSGETHGVGLLISKAVINRLGGDIECRSIQGEGTTFEIVLPIV